MRIFSINRSVKGCRTLRAYAIRFAYVFSIEAKQCHRDRPPKEDNLLPVTKHRRKNLRSNK